MHDAQVLAIPGHVTSPAGRQAASTRWRWNVLKSCGSHYCGVNRAMLFGRPGALAACAPPSAVPGGAPGQVVVHWTPGPDWSQVQSLKVVAFAGSEAARSGGFFQAAAVDAEQHVFTGLTPGQAYVFSVVPVGEARFFFGFFLGGGGFKF